jgi:LCP family protein required for cell wall assembly
MDKKQPDAKQPGHLYKPGQPSRRNWNAGVRQFVHAPNLPLRTLPKPTPRKPRRSPTRVALAIFLMGLAIGCSVLSIGYYFYSTIQQPLAQFVHPVSRSADEPPPNTTPTYDIIKGRSWNLLLLGSDNDGKYTFPALLTQVMMVVHVDTVNNTIQMVSIPRDSWVSVPEVGGMHKIDQAFFLGASRNNTFDNGVRLARLTIERDYGITIDRYGWVGLNGFAKVIDTLGGIDIDVTHPIVDDIYPDDTGKQADPHNPYAYRRLYLTPGPQHLNGEQALAYVRSRHADLVGDIGRTQRQQQVLQALKQKLNVSNVIGHLDALLKALNGQVYTDLSEEEMLAFANFARTLDTNTVQRLTLGPGTGKQNFGSYASVYDPLSNSQQSVIIPNCATIQPVINTIFGLGGIQSCNVGGNGI